MGTRTPDLYRVNPQFIGFTTTYRRSQGLLTPLSACKFVRHRVGHRVGTNPLFAKSSTELGEGERPLLLPELRRLPALDNLIIADGNLVAQTDCGSEWHGPCHSSRALQSPRSRLPPIITGVPALAFEGSLCTGEPFDPIPAIPCSGCAAEEMHHALSKGTHLREQS